MTDNNRELKNTFARYATGVTIVSCMADGADGQGSVPLGITVNSFSSVSLVPPLVLWCIDKGSGVFDAYNEASHYAVTILTADQQHIADRFAMPGNHDFEAGEYESWESGCPVLNDRLAGLDCEVVSRHDAGDHVILVGKVLRHDHFAGKPLMYVGRNYVQGIEINDL